MTLVRLRTRLAAAVCLSTLFVGGHAATAADDDGQWTMPGKNYAATRYSGLTEINAQNAKGLHPVWTFSTGVLGGHQGQPLVVNNTMYVVTPYPNVLYAFDLTKEGYPLRWKYRPVVSPNAVGVACCDAINRGASYADGKIFYNLLDGHRRGGCEDGPRAAGHSDRRHVRRRDHADGATCHQRPRHRRCFRRRVRDLRLAEGSRREDRQDRLDGRNIGPDADMLIKPSLQIVLRQGRF